MIVLNFGPSSSPGPQHFFWTWTHYFRGFLDLGKWTIRRFVGVQIWIILTKSIWTNPFSSHSARQLFKLWTCFFPKIQNIAQSGWVHFLDSYNPTFIFFGPRKIADRRFFFCNHRYAKLQTSAAPDDVARVNC